MFDTLRHRCAPLECNMTDVVWACVTCGFMACGGTASSHAEGHFEETGHSIVIEVNDEVVHW